MFRLPHVTLDLDPADYRQARHAFVYSQARRVWQRFVKAVLGPVIVGGLGGDVSKWQVGVDWGKAKEGTPPNPGWQFVFIRWLFGLSVDTKASAHWANSQIAKFKRGAYAYYLDAYDPEEQAQKLYDVLAWAGDLGEIVPVGDFEEISNLQLTASKVRDYLEALEGLFGKTPIVYTGKFVWDKWIGNVSWAKHYPLWIAQYPLVGWQADHLNKVKNYPPVLPKPWTSWEVWQFTASCPAGLYGVSGNVVDLDYCSPGFALKYLGGPPAGGAEVRKAKCLIGGLKVRSTPVALASDANKVGNLGLNEVVSYVPGLVERPNATDEWWPVRTDGKLLGFAAAKHSSLAGPGLVDIGEV